MDEQQFDLVVIGGGPAGYVGAIRAAQLGLKTAVVEREHLGGICLNWGCIPTKALLHTANVYRQMQHLPDLGLAASSVSIDFTRVVQRSREIAGQLSNGVAHLLRKNKVTVLTGSARFSDAHTLEVEMPDKAPARLRADHIMIATGARARTLPGVSADGEYIWSYKQALAAKSLPLTLLVIGGGAIGMEFASFFATLGSKVTLVEALDRVLPAEDDEVSAFVAKEFGRQGIEIMNSTSVKSLNVSGTSVTAVLVKDDREQTHAFDRVLVSIGVTGNTEGLGLDSIGVEVKGGYIVADEWGRTRVPGVYAVGDVAGGPCLAHKASHEAVLCVEKIGGQGSAHPLRRDQIPACTYAHPQVASIGMTEKQAVAAGRKVKLGRFPFLANGKALAIGESAGFVKTVFDGDTGELLGAHMCGPEVTELVQGFGIARALEATEAELTDVIFAHPTLSEAMHESVLSAYARSLHF
jgi:dihydrolipoamide dehydrogenase